MFTEQKYEETATKYKQKQTILVVQLGIYKHSQQPYHNLCYIQKMQSKNFKFRVLFGIKIMPVSFMARDKLLHRTLVFDICCK